MITIEAIYENGNLKLDHPLPLKEHDRVRVTIHTGSTILMQSYGIMGWTGDAEILERIALDPEFLPEEAP
jgi:predicted DNA-binding antitoxin AbrB/MazE fold protein